MWVSARGTRLVCLLFGIFQFNDELTSSAHSCNTDVCVCSVYIFIYVDLRSFNGNCCWNFFSSSERNREILLHTIDYITRLIHLFRLIVDCACVLRFVRLVCIIEWRALVHLFTCDARLPISFAPITWTINTWLGMRTHLFFICSVRFLWLCEPAHCRFFYSRVILSASNWRDDLRAFNFDWEFFSRMYLLPFTSAWFDFVTHMCSPFTNLFPSC